jgi:peptidoglycan/xylan/chitin deacetylase (PgdA/CDA1 family)
LTAEGVTALTVEPGRIPAALPQTLDDIQPPLGLSEGSRSHGEPTTLFLTIDVEDAYFDRPILMTGDGIGREFGVFGILDQLDLHGLKATFFVNVYEADRQPRGVVEGVVREIVEHGHEVGLHSHPSPFSELYRRPLFRLPRSQQADILRCGMELIDRWTGAPPTSFRAGGYACDDHTFTALEEVGIAIDSSCFFPSANNRQERFTVNAVATRGSIVEAPVTTVLRLAASAVEQRKLDINWLSVDELMAALVAVCDHGAGFATFMMHSFSFIEKTTRRAGEPPAAGAIFSSEDIFGCCVDVYGPRPSLRTSFSSFLERIAAEPRLRVRTLSEALPELRVAAGVADVIPVISVASKVIS